MQAALPEKEEALGANSEHGVDQPLGLPDHKPPELPDHPPAEAVPAAGLESSLALSIAAVQACAQDQAQEEARLAEERALVTEMPAGPEREWALIKLEMDEEHHSRRPPDDPRL